jgi:DNA-binding MarR family transcriptional regulator
MAKTLARMRRDGLIREEPDPADGRRTRYQLTPRARAMEADLAAAGHEVIAAATRGIPAARLAAFEQALNEMAANLTATAGEESRTKAPQPMTAAEALPSPRPITAAEA